ncbi:MAG: hypothetical protein ACM3XM_01845 [Mycobacterium leprae]
MQLQGVSTTTTSLGTLQCVSGVVNLFQFVVPPRPGSIIGQVTTTGGFTVLISQSQPTPPGGTTLASVDGRFATVCGRFTFQNGQRVLDVLLVNPGACPPCPVCPPQNNQLLLLLLLLLLQQPGLLSSTGLGPLFSQVLGQSGLSSSQLTGLLQSLTGRPF